MTFRSRRVSVHFIRDVHRHPQRHHTAGIVEEVRLWKEKNRAFKVRLIRDRQLRTFKFLPFLQPL